MSFWDNIKRLFSREAASDEAPAARATPRTGGGVYCFAPSAQSAMSIATVYRCVQVLADSVAGLRLQYMRLKDGRYQEDVGSPLHYLLSVQPQPEMSVFDFWSMAVKHMLLQGDAYVYPRRVDGQLTDLVLCSRGSVIPLWIEQIRSGHPVTVTEPGMTRFIMSLEEAVDLVLFAFEHGQNGDILVQKAPACTIQTQAEAVCELFGGRKEDIRVIGIRHGEKMYETLLTKEECAKAEDMGDFYRVPADNRSLNYDKYFTEGDTKRAMIEEFNSDNTRRLNLEETKAKIASLEYIQNELKGLENIAK